MERLRAALLILAIGVASNATEVRAESLECKALDEVRRVSLGREGTDGRIPSKEEQEAATSQLVSANDACYIDRRLLNALLGSMVVRLGIEASNGVFNASSIGQNAVAELDETTVQHRALIGYSNRPLLRDIALLAGQGAINSYRQARYEPWRWALLDAVKFTAMGGFGTTVSPDANREKFDTANDLVFEVGLTYELPLERLGTPFIEK